MSKPVNKIKEPATPATSLKVKVSSISG